MRQAVLTILWEFRVKAGREAEFERRYGPEGDWAQLFRRSPAYRGTELLRDTAEPGRYLTLDRWESSAAYEEFKRQVAQEYAALDRECEALTESERCLGRFEPPG